MAFSSYLHEIFVKLQSRLKSGVDFVFLLKQEEQQEEEQQEEEEQPHQKKGYFETT